MGSSWRLANFAQSEVGFLHSNHNAGVASTETNYEASTQQLECEGNFILNFHHIGKGCPLSRNEANSPSGVATSPRRKSEEQASQQIK